MMLSRKVRVGTRTTAHHLETISEQRDFRSEGSKAFHFCNAVLPSSALEMKKPADQRALYFP
jgi:hypothetical protein